MNSNLRGLAWAGLGALVGILIFATRPVAHALPEYTTRTGETCATCHVNPAGGGPRTVRGALWIAAGKPDKVPPLPGVAAPNGDGTRSSNAAADGAALYARVGCAECHGLAGEGASGPAIDQREMPAGQLSHVTQDGKDTMPGYGIASMSEAELASLLQYVQAIGRGEVKPQAKRGPVGLGPIRLSCGNASEQDSAASSACGGN